MQTLISVIIVVVIFFVIINLSKTWRTRSKQPNYNKHLVPKQLNLQREVILEDAESRLKAGLPKLFVKQLKGRMLEKFPRMSESEFDWKFFELKRYFMMTAIMKSVPMYSDSVDDIWHEMLMFTREYQEFGEKFIGSSIHHAPHSSTASSPNPGERAWFEWVYSQLFAATPYTGVIWKGFFRNPLDTTRIEELRLMSEESLVSRLFNQRTVEQYPEIRSAVSLLIAKAKRQISGAEHNETYDEAQPSRGTADFMPYMAGAMMFHSFQNDNGFEEQMQQYSSEDEHKRDPASTGDSSGYSCSGWDDNCADNGSSDGGSSSGDSGSTSSCSSSSCSSCGGGGD
ncbi:putative membrane protein YgcG [Paenibacillus sp. DS2015]|uniref:hypothetical protein n=1 Tax=Paenibacillus sp. DS2015 TaxID=3373917 RepID=UPI003D22DEA1